MSATAAAFRHSSASVLLDALRAGAAFEVLAGHWRSAFFVDDWQLANHRALLRPLYVLTGAGRESVLLFFVLSGFLISGSIFEARRRGQWNWRRYATHRLVRLWIVLIPALVAGALWDRLGIEVGHGPALYSGGAAAGLTRDAAHSLGWDVFLGNVAFMQSILVPPFGSNVALWTLANEFWYYALFPLGVCIVRDFLRPPWKTVACVAAAAAILVLLRTSPYVLPLFAVWLLGALLHLVPRRPTTLAQRAAATAAFALILFGNHLLPAHDLWGYLAISDLVFAAAAFGYLWVLLGAMQPAGTSFAVRLSRRAAGFSYTLYAVHLPVLLFAVAELTHGVRWNPGVGALALAACVLALIVAYAWCVGAATESKTDQVREWAERVTS